MAINLIKKNFKALGTEIGIWIVCDEEKDSSKELKKLEEYYLEKEKILSRFNPDSELSVLNKNPGKFQKASEDILYLSQKSLEYFELSRGFFDPRILEILEKIGYKNDFYSSDFNKEKSESNLAKEYSNLKEDLKIKENEVFFGRKMDFSGIAKGYITDKASEILRNKGYENFLLDSGGDMFASGKNEEGMDWEIALEGFPEDKFSLKIPNEGIATSGIARRKWENNGKKFHHLINPKNPENFSFELKSATVIESNTEKADAFAKTLFLMGKEKGLEFAERNNIAGIFLDYRGNIFISKEAKKYIILWLKHPGRCMWPE
jgi:FAD:protein FMN transferase